MHKGHHLMHYNQCASRSPHLSHEWWTDEQPPVRHACLGVRDTEPGGFDRNQCEDTRPHRAHTHWDSEAERVTLCEGVVRPAVHSFLDNCDCQPYSSDRCEYRMLADAVIASLPTRDGDEAEVSLCIESVERIGEALRLLRTPPGEV
jgi:hypothetical protein